MSGTQPQPSGPDFQPSQYQQPQYQQPQYQQPVDPYTIPLPPQPTMPQAPLPPAAPENVGRGLLFSLGGVVIGIVLTALVWKLGFLASITAYVLAAAAIWAYRQGSGGELRRGAVPLLATIIVGTIISMLGCVAIDAADYYRENAPAGADPSMAEFVLQMVVDPAVLREYTTDFAMMLLFAVLGMWGVVKSLLGSRG